MDKSNWKEKIKEACKSAGTYNECFNDVIDSLADILEKRDIADEEFVASGKRIVVEHANNRGAVNMTKNPALILWDDLNKSALSYWRDLGLTPKGYHALMGDCSFKKEKKSALVTALSDLDI